MITAEIGLTVQWICVAVIIVLSVAGIVRRVRRKGGGCGCGSRDYDGHKGSPSGAGCAGCPLSDRCTDIRSGKGGKKNG